MAHCDWWNGTMWAVGGQFMISQRGEGYVYSGCGWLLQLACFICERLEYVSVASQSHIPHINKLIRRKHTNLRPLSFLKKIKLRFCHSVQWARHEMALAWMFPKWLAHVSCGAQKTVFSVSVFIDFPPTRQWVWKKKEKKKKKQPPSPRKCLNFTQSQCCTWRISTDILTLRRLAFLCEDLALQQVIFNCKEVAGDLKIEPMEGGVLQWVHFHVALR